MQWEHGRIADLRLAVGSVSPFPARIEAAERLLRGTRAADARIREAAEKTIRGVSTATVGLADGTAKYGE